MAGYIKKAAQKAKKVYQKLSDPWWRAKKRYIQYVDALPIDPHCVLIESQHGTEMSGNVFYILKHLASDESYKEYTVYLCARGGRVQAFQKILDKYHLNSVRITVLASDAYFQILASAKYLINDNTFLPFFVKKDGQVYLNTWHGTPLKTLGRKIKNDAHAIGNAQKNFVCADYLLFPNEHTRKSIVEDYMLANIATGSSIMGGYPRNEAFFDHQRTLGIRNALGLTDKRVYAYMPTFRGTARAGGTSKSSHYMSYYLYELDKALTDDEILFVNLHPVAKKGISVTDFKHIRLFPVDYETYDFLSIADVLVTDYSSVFFDYANTRRKIVLFVYDKEEYLADRGMYMSLDELPFPQVATLEDLLRELRSEKSYDDTEFLRRFCGYENDSASKKLCDFVILGKDTGLEVAPIPNNGKENVLLYAGNLAGNGITTALLNLLNNIDLKKRNYYFCFYTEKVHRNNQKIFAFPKDACFFGMTDDPNLTIWDMIIRKAFHLKLIPAKLYMRMQHKRMDQELTRLLGGARFEHFIQFNGYESDVILTFSRFPGTRSIYVHNDMLREIRTRKNQRKDVLKYAYRSYDHVAIVTDDMLEPTGFLAGGQEKILRCQNLIDYTAIRKLANAEIHLDTFTKSNVTEDKLRRVLASGEPCFINIGRFSPEKGHDRLLLAFQKFHALHPEAHLVIMGGNSFAEGYKKTLSYAEELGIQDAVILLERVSNPYPILKSCGYFVLSSYYEGFGLVLVEADILGVPVISTDIPGPRGFMKKHGGTLVENSVEGIYAGMEMQYRGEVPAMHVDYAAYNREAVAEFEKLFTL